MVRAVLSGMSISAVVLFGVWRMLAHYEQRNDKAHAELRKAIERQGEVIERQGETLRDRIDAQGKESAEQLGQLRERMAKLEGLLEGLREAITGRRAA